jgi:hypothetical protein
MSQRVSFLGLFCLLLIYFLDSLIQCCLCLNRATKHEKYDRIYPITIIFPYDLIFEDKLKKCNTHLVRNMYLYLNIYMHYMSTCATTKKVMSRGNARALN